MQLAFFDSAPTKKIFFENLTAVGTTLASFLLFFVLIALFKGQSTPGTPFLQMFFLVLGGALLATVAAVWCAIYLTKRNAQRLAPIVELANLTEQIATLGDYSLRAPELESDELNAFPQHFNQLMAKIESWESDRQSEVRERKEAERRIDILSNHDSLTKLPNRTYFQSLSKQCFDYAIAHQQLAALMFIDIDNFKAMNEQFGYDGGDLILAAVAKRLCTVLRTTDTLCRVDGDEFAAILPNIDSEKMAQNLAERLIHVVNQPMTLRSKKVVLTASIGIACCPVHATERRAFLHNTDLALKQAKATGKNSFSVFRVA